MLIKRPDPIRPSEITSESNYLNRRQLMAGLAAGIWGAGPIAYARKQTHRLSVAAGRAV